MKCDVCLTNIPIGENRCPNCGFIMKTDHVTTFDVSDDDHAHIEVTTKSKLKKDLLKKKINIAELKNYQRNLPKTNKNIALKMVLIIMVIIITMVVSIVGAIISEIDYSYTFNDLTFTEVLDQEYDDGTVLKAMEFQKSFINHLSNNGYNDIHVVEYCNQYDDDPLHAYMSISTSKDHIDYTIDTNFSELQMETYTITLSGNYNHKQDMSKFPLSEKQVNEIAGYLGVNGYQIMKDSYPLMTLNNDEYKYTNYDSLNIYMVEQLQKEGQRYSFYYSIGN